MLKQAFTQIIQHIMAQNSGAQAELAPYGGKVVRVHIFPLQASLTILEDGNLALAGEVDTADVVIKIPPTVAMRLLANDEAANRLVLIEGDVALAALFSRVMRHVSWDATQDLSQIIGDAPAYQASQFVQKASAGIKKQARNMAEMLTEFWQEERPLLAKKVDIERFMHEVDILRDDAARLEQRFAKLQQQILAKNNASASNPSQEPN